MLLAAGHTHGFRAKSAAPTPRIMSMQKPIRDLALTFDAIDFNTREKRELFLRTFAKDHHCETLLQSNKYFLLGEKGTGKTAYAVFFASTNYSNTRSRVIFIANTDYQKFVQLKIREEMPISGYEDIWRVVLLLLAATRLREVHRDGLFTFLKFRRLSEAIDRYYQTAFTPEIHNAVTFATDSKGSLNVLSQFLDISLHITTTTRTAQTGFQLELLKIESVFQHVISDLKLEEDFIIFIDGIDQRPPDIDYDEYLRCMEGLANASWTLNTSFFSNIRDSRGRIRIVLLMRPDIFDKLNLHNRSAKARDNTVFLNWHTTYERASSSALFRITKHVLSGQQDQHVDDGQIWTRYFPFVISNEKTMELTDDPFIHFLRNSFYRPRDIIAHLWHAAEYCRANELDDCVFSPELLSAARRDFSNYLLGEMNDYLRFYYNRPYDDVVVEFFAFMDRKFSFNYEEFCEAYRRFREAWTVDGGLPEFCATERRLLQFLFENNIIAYRQRTGEGTFDHWAFRERGPTMLSPKVPPNQEYVVHAGLRAGLNLRGTFRLRGSQI